MKAILNDLTSLTGLNYGYIYQDDQVLATNFPEVLQDKLANVGHMIAQMFMSVDAIGQSHDEIHFELEDNFLIGYRIEDDLLVVLLTEKKINLPLIHMTIKSAHKKIKTLAANATPIAAQPSPPPSQAVVEPAAPANVPATTVSVETEEKIAKVLDLLVDYLGPAASIVFDDVADLWKRNFTPNQENLIELVRLLMQELDEKTEQKDFLKAASKIIQ